MSVLFYGDEGGRIYFSGHARQRLQERLPRNHALLFLSRDDVIQALGKTLRKRLINGLFVEQLREDGSETIFIRFRVCPGHVLTAVMKKRAAADFVVVTFLPPHATIGTPGKKEDA